MNKHTPGPWTVGTLCVWGPDHTYVAGTKTGIDKEAQKANARLIAAAPDLLAALEYILDWSPDGSKWSGETARDMGRAAIAKARGEC